MVQLWCPIFRPRVSDYDRDPSRRTPPRGRCWRAFSLQVGLGKLSQSVDWPLSHAWAMLQQSEDVSTTVKTLKKTLVGVQWYSVHVSQTAQTNPELTMDKSRVRGCLPPRWPRFGPGQWSDMTWQGQCFFLLEIGWLRKNTRNISIWIPAAIAVS